MLNEMLRLKPKLMPILIGFLLLVVGCSVTPKTRVVYTPVTIQGVLCPPLPSRFLTPVLESSDSTTTFGNLIESSQQKYLFPITKPKKP